MFLAGTSPGFQPANSRSSLGRISAIVVAPTTTSVAWLGLNQVSWKRTRSSRLMLAGGFLGARAGPGIGIGVARPIQQAGENPERQAYRVCLFLLDLSQPLFLQPLEILPGERRMQDHVGIDSQRGIQILLAAPRAKRWRHRAGSRCQVGAQLRQLDR